jgi:dTDP-glucose 4,6-dehydratase
MAMNLLITGGAGFIGSNLIRRVIDCPEVERLVNMDCLTYAGHIANLAGLETHPKYVFTQTDLRNEAEVRKIVRRHQISHVIHLAAESHVDRSIAAPADFIHTNIVGTFHLLEACRAAWLCNPEWARRERCRFLHVSTDEVYGSLGETGLFTETSNYDPRSPYSASKASSDFLVRSYFHTYGLPVLVTNCSNNYGPYQYPEKLIPVVIQSALHGRPIPVYGDGRNVRDWLYVLDHADALWKVITSGKAGETYNIGGGNEWTNLELVNLICRIMEELCPGLHPRPSELITFVADRPGHDKRYAIDATKLRTTLGWSPAYSFESGIRDTIQWYLDYQDWVTTVSKRPLFGHPARVNQTAATHF